MKDVQTTVISTEDFDDYIQITEKIVCGKLKWLPTLIQQRQDERKEEGYSLIEEKVRKVYCLTNFRYGTLLIFRKEK